MEDLSNYVPYKEMTYEQKREYHKRKNKEYHERMVAMGFHKVNGHYKLKPVKK